MLYYADLEFMDDGYTIDVISIGIVAEDGREYYAQSTEYAEESANDWVEANVFPHLKLCPCCGHKCNHEGKCRHADCPWRNHMQMTADVAAFCDPEKYGPPIFMLWCGAYDWVAICQLFGTMMDLPKGWPHSFHEIQQDLDAFQITDDMLPSQEGEAHNALADARHIHAIMKWFLFGRDEDSGPREFRYPFGEVPPLPRIEAST